MTHKHVLVAPLDWGLGHATRCIPIIQILLDRGAQVSIATSGGALALLQSEFPGLKFFDLPAYNPKYSSRTPLALKILFQSPHWLSVIRKEQVMVASIIEKNSIDVIISDNRYGCRSKKVKSVFITHQVNLIMPWWLKWASRLFNHLHHRQISHFSECWIPDDPVIKLTGKMTASQIQNTKLIGILSRFKFEARNIYEYKYLAIISGPEPQRTIFEKKIRKQLKHLNEPALLIKGKPVESKLVEADGPIKEVNHLSSSQLLKMLLKSEVIIARSGYSTIMDLYMLGAKAIFVPTPGQTEQKYLASELLKRKIAFYQDQNQFDLTKALKESKTYSGFAGSQQPANLLIQAIDSLLQ